jgi:hypothetical protein
VALVEASIFVSVSLLAVDELVEVGIWIFVVGREEYYGGLVTGEPLSEAVNDDR